VPAPDGQELLDGRYELLELVGIGGASEVWRARDHRLQRDVAVKVLSGPAARDPAHRRRIEREARALAAISHPHVVGIYDYSEQPAASGEPLPFIVMELVDGADLARHLQRTGPMDAEAARGLLLGLLSGVEQAHRLGIVHGDLKPANILLSASGPKVVDFGVARILSDETGTTRVAATPAYAPPEVLGGDRPEAPSDVYSAGCIGFELLTGRPPFGGSTVWEVSRQHAEAPVPSPRAIRPEIPEDLDHAIRRALAKDPAERPPDAAAFAELLGAEVPAAVEAAIAPAAASTPTLQVVHQRTETLGPDEKPRRRRPSPVHLLKRVPIGIALGLVAVMAITLLRGSATAAVRVPELRGLPLPAAAKLADEEGFDVRIQDVAAGGVKGTVVAQDPPPAAIRSRPALITLHVTKGAPQTKVPDVAGMRVDQAREAITKAVLTVGDVSYQPATAAAAGTVLRTDPAKGEQVDEGTKVHIVAAAIPLQDTSSDRGNGRGRGKKDKDDDD
jgi:eukaryotic-like serine/threonine-protein kinase